MMALPPRLLIFCLTLVLAACGGNDRRAPVEQRQTASPPAPDLYQVRGGDTLYAIAFRYGKDYRQLAAANGIAAPYTIYPGQTLYLNRRAPKTTTTARSSAAKPATKPAAAVPPTARPASTPSATAPVKQPTRKPVASSSYVGKNPGVWRWPTEGRVVRGFSNGVHKGIDIDGRAGDPVIAVAAGKVVYAGNGIVGFGNLLIIKHSEAYLSAYGHNRALLVAEGDTVTTGQKIAEKGSSGTDTVKLHFEIRRDGRPIDPQKLLPLR